MESMEHLPLSLCKCGQPFEYSCICSERVMERFTEYNSCRVFYYDDLREWGLSEFGLNSSKILSNCVTIDTIINDALNLEGVIELGTDAYQSPFEV